MADLKEHMLLVHKPEINSSERNSEEKIDLSLGILHSNVDSAIQRLDGKFQSSLNLMEEIVDNQNKKISEMEQYIEFLSNRISQQQQHQLQQSQMIEGLEQKVEFISNKSYLRAVSR